VALNHTQIGALEEAARSLATATAIAESTGDPRLLVGTAWSAGIVHAVKGEADAAVQACARAVDRAPDPVTRAIATGWLGFALMEKGEAAEAIVRLTLATRVLGQFGDRSLHGWFTAFLAEARRGHGQPDVATEVAKTSLQISTDARTPVAVGWARLVLGRAAIDADAHAEAQAHLEEARAIFAAIGSRYEMARTETALAIACHAQGEIEGAGSLLRAAYRLFTEIGAPEHARRARRLADELALTL